MLEVEGEADNRQELAEDVSCRGTLGARLDCFEEVVQLVVVDLFHIGTAGLA